MKNDSTFKLTLLVIMTGVAFALFSPSAHAGDAGQVPSTLTRTGTYRSSTGNSGAVNSTVTHGAGERTRLTTITNQNGQASVHSSSRTWDRASGTGTVVASTTDFAGATLTRQGTLKKNADGSVSGQGTITGPNGQTSTYADMTVKTASGHSTTGTIVGPNGKVGTFDTEVARSPDGQITRTTTETGPDGGTTTRTLTLATTP